MKCAIWGTGSIANTHARALKKIGVEIAACVGNDYERTKIFADKYGIKTFGTDKELLFKEDIDCVHICTPPNLHYETASSLLKNGKNVLCEKPLCFDKKQALELKALSEEKGLLCGVNFNVRYYEAIKNAKKIIKNGEMGKILLVHGSYLQEFHLLPTEKSWRYDEKTAGKMRAVTEIGSHFIDLLTYLTGEKITAVSALFGRYNKERKLNGSMMNLNVGENISVLSEDSAVILAKLENNGLVSFTLSEVSQGRINRLAIEITGSKKNLWWDSENIGALNTAQGRDGIKTYLYPFNSGFDGSFEELIADFYSGIKGNGCNFPTAEDGAYNIAVCDAIYESANNDGGWVKI